MTTTHVRTLVLAFLLSAPAALAAQTPAANEADQRLKALYNAEWEWRQKEEARVPGEFGRHQRAPLDLWPPGEGRLDGESAGAIALKQGDGGGAVRQDHGVGIPVAVDVTRGQRPDGILRLVGVSRGKSNGEGHVAGVRDTVQVAVALQPLRQVLHILFPVLVAVRGTHERASRDRSQAQDDNQGQAGPQILGGGKASGKKFLGAIADGHHVRFASLNLSTSASVTCRVASAGQGGVIEFHAGTPSGALLAKCEVQPTGGWEEFVEVHAPLSPTSEPRTDVVMRFVNPGKGGLMNVDWVQFNPR